VSVVLCVALASCEDDGAADDPSSDASASGGGSGSSEPVPEPFCEDDVTPGAMPGLARLTHAQYDNTVRGLLGIEASPSTAFLADPVVGVFDNDAAGLFVTGRQARDYMRAAEDLAAEVAGDGERWRDLVPCDPQMGLVCAAEFVRSFGRRALRRPLSEDEEDRYLQLFERGDALFDEGTSFARGVRIVIETMLQSPSFLYREELGDYAEGAVRALDGWEVASRLSYLLWGAGPDDELLDAAQAGVLETRAGVETAARRMLADPRAHAAVDDFHRQWLALERYGGLTKHPETYPEWSPALDETLRQEALRFVRRVVFDLSGSYVDLFTLPETYADATLAALYGVSGDFGDELELVELDAQERAGLLTQIGFLASNAHAVQTSPIHRGVFVQRRVLCNEIPDPPGEVDASIPSVGKEVETTREAVELHTSDAACSGCHELINEPGFSFEGYDAIGRVRHDENGVRIDASGSVVVDDAEVPFTDAIELSQAIAYSETGPRCYATQWFRYANMRRETPADACTLDGLHAAWEASGYQVEELLVALTQTGTFRHRAEREDSE
jgi:hypothetical protein